MNAIRRAVVATLLAVWCFPVVSMANPAPASPAPLTAQSARSVPATRLETATPEADALAAREQQARQLQDFEGGRGVYIGSGVVVVILVVLLIVLLV
jgi:hypothetical protein